MIIIIIGRRFQNSDDIKDDQELAQAEPKSHPRNQNWKQPKLQIDIIQ